VTQPQVVIIPDPELLLPDESLPSGITIVAHSTFIGGEYTSLAALVAQRKKAEHALNLGLAEWQRGITPPCHVVFSTRNDATGERLFVFGDIPDMDALTKSERAAGVTDLAALRKLSMRIDSGLRRGWLYGKWFSRTQPEGEWGVMHKKFLQSPMSEAEFESFRAKGWVTGDEGTPA
jgi:hypothetical protein